MYYITTKSGVTPAVLFGTRDNRDLARAFAKINGGTVRTESEYAEMFGLAHPDNIAAAHREIAQREAEGEDMTGATVDPSTSAIVKPTPAPVAPTWIDMAKEVAKAPKVANTIGKKEKFLKRVITPEVVLVEAAAYLRSGDVTVSKVDTVRSLANWKAQDGTKLQRRDALKLIGEARPDISPATVGTQWQLVRSGKM